MTAYEVVLDNAKLIANCFERTIIEISAYDEGPGFIHDAFVLDAPSWTGSYPRLSDGDDSSWATLSAQSHVDPIYLSSNPIAAYFRAPGGFEPTAIAYKFRARSSIGTPQHAYVLQTRISKADNSVEFLNERIATAADITTNEFSDLMITDGVVVLATLESFWPGVTFNSNNPTDGGGWLEFVFDGVPEIIPEFVGDGIRIDIGVHQEEDVDTSVHHVFELHEFRLLVAGHYI